MILLRSPSQLNKWNCGLLNWVIITFIADAAKEPEATELSQQI